MAKRKGLRVTCAVCRRIFYLSAWGEPLPDHATGRGNAPACGGSRRADYLPASQEGVEAQLQWAAQAVPSAPRKGRRTTSPATGMAGASKRIKAEAEAARLQGSLQDLIDKGIELSESRRTLDGGRGMESLERHLRLLGREKELRQELDQGPGTGD